MLRYQRLLHTSRTQRSLWGDWFGRKKPETNGPTVTPKDLIKQQDEYEMVKDAKIKIYNKTNSPNIDHFDVNKHMPDFKIIQWKKNVLSRQNIEKAFTEQQVEEKLFNIYNELKGTSATDNTDLNDLKFRFVYSKQVQSELGIDIPDLVLTESHTIGIMKSKIVNIINKRFKHERNPNDINLRPSDFDSGNIYVNQELDESQQAKAFKRLVDEARKNL